LSLDCVGRYDLVAYYMRDPYTDNNLIDYYTQNYIQFCYLITMLLDLHFSFYSLPSN